MQQDKLNSELLAEVAEMDRDLQRLRMRAKYVKARVALLIFLGAAVSGFVIAFSHTAGHVRADAVLAR